MPAKYATLSCSLTDQRSDGPDSTDVCRCAFSAPLAWRVAVSLGRHDSSGVGIARRAFAPRLGGERRRAGARRGDDDGEPPCERDEPLSLAARPQSGGLVSVGRGGAGTRAARRQADLAFGGLLRLPLVP